MNVANASIYSSGKAAVNAVMKIAAVELAQRKIRVNAISPGPIETEILNKAGYSEEELKGVKAWIINNIPMRKMGEASDVAKLVAYLSSEGSGFITGSEILMDGGMSFVKAVFGQSGEVGFHRNAVHGRLFGFEHRRWIAAHDAQGLQADHQQRNPACYEEAHHYFTQVNRLVIGKSDQKPPGPKNIQVRGKAINAAIESRYKNPLLSR